MKSILKRFLEQVILPAAQTHNLRSIRISEPVPFQPSRRSSPMPPYAVTSYEMGGATGAWTTAGPSHWRDCAIIFVVAWPPTIQVK